MRSERERGDEQRGHWGLKENAKRKKKKSFRENDGRTSELSFGWRKGPADRLGIAG